MPLDGVTSVPPEFAARYRQRGYWEDRPLIAHFDDVFTEHGDRVALVAGKERVTYRQLGERVERLARHLLDLGYRPLDRVVLHLPNVAEFVYLYFALQHVGAVPLLALPLHRHREISHYVEFIGARGYAVPDRVGDFDYLALAGQVVAAGAALDHVLVAGDKVPKEAPFVSIRRLLAGEPRATATDLDGVRATIDPEDPCCFQLSGGTTGIPKVIPRSHNDYVYNCKAAAAVNDIGPEDALLVVLPVAHNFPLASPGLQGFLLAGAQIVLSASPRAEYVLPLIEQEGITHLEIVPALVIRWLEDPRLGGSDLSSVRVVNSGGQKWQPETGLGASGLAGGVLLGRAAGAAPAPPGTGALRTRLTDAYGIKYPIVQAGMAFYATPALAAAVTNAGGLGVLGPVPEAPPGLRAQIQETRQLTTGPFGVDFVYFPFFNTTLNSPGYEDDPEHQTRNVTWSINDHHVDVLIEEKVDFVVWYWTAPEARWVKRLKAAGIKQWAQVGSVAGALEAVAYGAEVIIAQGKQGGGHVRGFQDGNPLHRSEIVPLVKSAVPDEVLVLGSGGIADGRTLANTLAEGADGGWVGTRFAVSEESYAHEEYMRRVIAVTDGWNETTPTAIFGPEFPSAYTRSIVNRVLSEWKGKEDAIPTPPPGPAVVGTARLMPWSVEGGIPYAMGKFSVIIPTRGTTGDFDEMCLLAGAESSPLIKSVKPAAQIVADMAAEAAALRGA